MVAVDVGGHLHVGVRQLAGAAARYLAGLAPCSAVNRRRCGSTKPP